MVFNQNNCTMNWFLAKIIFQVICGNGKHPAQFEEQIRLIQAADKAAAFAKANALAKSEEESFFSLSNKMICWKMVAVTDIFSFDATLDGAELFSGTRVEENADAFIYSARLRANDVLNEPVEIFHS